MVSTHHDIGPTASEMNTRWRDKIVKEEAIEVVQTPAKLQPKPKGHAHLIRPADQQDPR